MSEIEITTKNLICPIEGRSAIFTFKQPVFREKGVITVKKRPFIECEFDSECESCTGKDKNEFINVDMDE